MSEQGSSREVFDARTAQWQAWKAQPWARLRYTVTAAAITRALTGLPGRLRIIDVGGGDGADSLPLARAGHDVWILDFSAPLLRTAADAARSHGVSDRVVTVRADIDDLAALRIDGQSAAGTFDVVLCHNVVNYRADPASTIADVARLARPGGVVSVMAPNPAMDVLAAVVRLTDPQAALAVLDAPTVDSVTFDHPMRRVEAVTAETALVAAGCTVEHRFGIRCVIDLIADDELKHEPDFYQRLLELELALCAREPYWRTARFWQLAARRN